MESKQIPVSHTNSKYYYNRNYITNMVLDISFTPLHPAISHKCMMKIRSHVIYFNHNV